MLFRIYRIEKKQKKQKPKTKKKKEKTKKTNRHLKRQLAASSHRFKWRQLSGSQPPPNPGLPPLLQTYRPLLRRPVLTAKCPGGRSLPPLQKAAGSQPPFECRFAAISANIGSDYLFS
jgi:hypothetical protein